MTLLNILFSVWDKNSFMYENNESNDGYLKKKKQNLMNHTGNKWYESAIHLKSRVTFVYLSPLLEGGVTTLCGMSL